GRWRLLADEPEAVHQHLRSTFRSENLAAVVEDDRGLAMAGPGVLAAEKLHQPILRLERLADQPQVVLLAEYIEGQHPTENRRGLDADEHGCMHPAGEGRAIERHDVDVRVVFGQLADLRRRR